MQNASNDTSMISRKSHEVIYGRFNNLIIWLHNVIIFSQELSATHFLMQKLNLSSEKLRGTSGACPSGKLR